MILIVLLSVKKVGKKRKKTKEMHTKRIQKPNIPFHHITCDVCIFLLGSGKNYSDGSLLGPASPGR